MTSDASSKPHWLPETLLAGALLVTILAVFIPLSPSMPKAGLDTSWAYATNEAVAHGIDFGKELIFTFGPYSSIYSRSYHPATDHLMIYGSLFLALGYAVGLWVLTRNRPPHWKIAFCVILAATMVSWDPQLFFFRDSLLFSYPLILALIVYRYTLPDSSKEKISYSRWTPLFAAFLSAPLGLMPLIKGSTIMICAAVAGLCILMFLARKEWKLIAAAVLAPLVTIAAFWLWANQSLEALPYYFVNMAPIVSGYTEAMAKSGSHTEVFLYILVALGILYLVLTTDTSPYRSRIFCALAVSAFLFIAFKGGFVRHDTHAIIASTSALLAVALLAFVLQHRHLIVVFLLSVMLWGFIYKSHVEAPFSNVLKDVARTYVYPYNGLKLRLSENHGLLGQFENSLALLKAEGGIPPLEGTTDIYSYNQAFLLASGNKWSPRPILQSYSAYTQKLALENEAHLLSDRAPDNVIFRVEPPDRRLPSLEDGVSWPVLIKNYSLSRVANDFVYLRKKSGRNTRPALIELHEGEHRFGETILLPDAKGPIYAKLGIKLNFLGRLVSFLYKPNQLEINIELTDGSRKNFRIISSMTESGFVISPLVENSTEFALLYGERRYWDNKIVKSIQIGPRNGVSALWNSDFTLNLLKLNVEPDQ